jgi:hypothetical protein
MERVEKMAQMKRPRLQSIKVLKAKSNHSLRLEFVDGSTYTVDFAPLLAESKGLKPLKDPAVFAQATLIDGEGWAVVWPEQDIQIGADTLWLDAQAQNAPDENTRIFAQWRARNGLSLTNAAQALGMSTRTISAYGSGKRAVPRYMALACKGWTAEQAQRTGN